LAPTRRPFVCSCTAALLIADYEEMGFLEPAFVRNISHKEMSALPPVTI
jgi:hypothetical protein